jgi:hypothetical protein
MGDDRAGADLLALPVTRGARAVVINDVTSDLEDVFLRLRRGKVV